MNEQRSWTVPKIIYAGLMSFLLLGYMIIIVTYKDPTTTGQIYNLPIQFWILRVITAIMAICLGKLWKDKGFLILMAYLLLKAIRVVADNPNYLFDQGVSESLLTGLWVFSACYGLARILEKDQLKRFLSINVSIWTVGMVIYSGIGIYAAWTDSKIYTIGKGAIWGIVEFRLFLSYYATTAASVLSLSIIMALCVAYITKKKIGRVLYIISVIPLFIALCLTDARGAQVSVGVGIACISGIIILKWISNKQKILSNKWYVLPISIVVSGAVFLLILLLGKITNSSFLEYRTKGLFISKAFAESVFKMPMSNRGFFGNNMLSDRPEIWNAVLTTIRSNPQILLAGSSIYHPMDIVNHSGLLGFTASHCHCMPLMILLENGIPGFLLIGYIVVLAISRCIHGFFVLYKQEETVAIPIILSVFVGELVECFTWLRSGQCPTLPFLFITLGIILYQHKAEKTYNLYISV